MMTHHNVELCLNLCNQCGHLCEEPGRGCAERIGWLGCWRLWALLMLSPPKPVGPPLVVLLWKTLNGSLRLRSVRGCVWQELARCIWGYDLSNYHFRLACTVCRYLDWSKQQDDPLPCTLPGRVLLLERAASAGTNSAASKLAPTSSHNTFTAGKEAGAGKATGTAIGSSIWQAWWLTGEQLNERGIIASRNTVMDHWASRLLGVLGDLAAADGGEGSALALAPADDAASKV